jgi:hypothetical protein
VSVKTAGNRGVTPSQTLSPSVLSLRIFKKKFLCLSLKDDLALSPSLPIQKLYFSSSSGDFIRSVNKVFKKLFLLLSHNKLGCFSQLYLIFASEAGACLIGHIVTCQPYEQSVQLHLNTYVRTKTETL